MQMMRTKVDLSQVPVLLAWAAVDVATPGGLSTGFLCQMSKLIVYKAGQINFQNDKLGAGKTMMDKQDWAGRITGWSDCCRMTT